MRETVEIRPQFIIQRNGKRYVLFAGLLDAAHRSGLQCMTTELIQVPSQDNSNTAITRTTVTLSPESRTGSGGEALVTTGLGDASPSNVAKHLVGCIIRMSETRSKARALRDAINVDVCSVEELDAAGHGEDSDGDIPAAEPARPSAPRTANPVREPPSRPAAAAPPRPAAPKAPEQAPPGPEHWKSVADADRHVRHAMKFLGFSGQEIAENIKEFVSASMPAERIEEFRLLLESINAGDIYPAGRAA